MCRLHLRKHGQHLAVDAIDSVLRNPNALAWENGWTIGHSADRLPETVWLVRLDQPAGLLARVLLDPHVPMQAQEVLNDFQEVVGRKHLHTPVKNWNTVKRWPTIIKLLVKLLQKIKPK